MVSKAGVRARAVSTARRVFPDPPAPTRVTRWLEPATRRTSDSTSASRPMKEVVASGRRWRAMRSEEMGGKASAAPTWKTGRGVG